MYWPYLVNRVEKPTHLWHVSQDKCGAGYVFQMTAKKYQSFLKISKYFNSPEFQEPFRFFSDRPAVISLFIWLNCYIFVELNIPLTESIYTKLFLSYENLFVYHYFLEWSQRVEQTWKQNDLDWVVTVTMFQW